MKCPIPTWALPTLSAVTADETTFMSARGRLGGQARARALTQKQLRQIALDGVEARLTTMSAKERSEAAQKSWETRKKNFTPEETAAVMRRAQAASVIAKRENAKHKARAR